MSALTYRLDGHEPVDGGALPTWESDLPAENAVLDLIEAVVPLDDATHQLEVWETPDASGPPRFRHRHAGTISPEVRP